MNDITIVTAFFDIGRGDINYIRRRNETYLSYFSVWARMKNNLVVYTYPEMAVRVKEIRAVYGLSKQTLVIEIDNVFDIEGTLLQRMKDISNSPDFRNYRLKTYAYSNRASYCYVTMMKFWYLQDAVNKVKDNKWPLGMFAWLDFGFNHGGRTYTKEEEFNAVWSTSLSTDKIHMFVLNESYKKPIHILLRTLEDSVIGTFIILPHQLCTALWDGTRNAMSTIMDIGFIDDDQLLLTFAYQKNPHLFSVHYSYWNLPIKETGMDHLTLVKGYGEKTIKWRMVNVRGSLYLAADKISFLLRFLRELWMIKAPQRINLYTKKQ